MSDICITGTTEQLDERSFEAPWLTTQYKGRSSEPGATRCFFNEDKILSYVHIINDNVQNTTN